MASIQWPVSLPQQPLQSGYSESEEPNLLRSQTEAGPAKVRRRFTKSVLLMSLTFRMTKDQVGVFETFFRDTAKHGALPFDFTNPRTEASGEYRFVTGSRAPYTISPVSDSVYDVAMQFEEV